ncbi:hypothetical protein D3C84_768600 [compost metagenome]
MITGGAIHFPDRRTSLLLIHAVLADVAVRAYRDVQLAAVLAGNHIFGPMVIQCPARQVDDFDRLRLDGCVAGFVVKAQQAIRVGHVQVVAHQRHAEWRVEVFQEHRAGLSDAVVIAVAQQRDAVRARYACSGAAHDFLGDPALDAFGVIGLGRGVGFGDQDVAIGQHVQPAWVIEIIGKCADLSAAGRHGFCTVRPADGRGYVHRRE